MTESQAHLLIVAEDVSGIQVEVEAVKHVLQSSPAWLSWLALKAFESLHEPIEIVTSDLDADSTPSASNLGVRAQLTDEFVLFMTALRAGNGDAGALVDFERKHSEFLKKKEGSDA